MNERINPPSFEGLEGRVLLSVAVPTTTFYVPDEHVSDPADLVVVTGGVPYDSGGVRIQNGETSALGKIVVPNNGSLKIQNRGDGWTDGVFDVIGASAKKLELGKIRSEVHVDFEGNIESLSLESIKGYYAGLIPSPGRPSHLNSIECGSAGTITIKGSYTGDIKTLTGNLTKLFVGHSFVGNLSVFGNLGSFTLDSLGGRNDYSPGDPTVQEPYDPETNISVEGTIGTITLGKGVFARVPNEAFPPGSSTLGYPVGYNPDMVRTNIHALTIKTINTGGRNIAHSSIDADYAIGTVSVADLYYSTIGIGGENWGTLSNLTAKNISSSTINVGTFEDYDGRFGVDFSKIGSVKASGLMSNSKIYGVNTDPFTLTIGKKRITINKTTSFSENGNDIETFVPVYSGERKVVNRVTEGRFFYKGQQHFMTMMNSWGAFALRAHPGTDVNGWGSTLYMQPFLAGAELKNTVIDRWLIGKDGIEVYAHGKVSQGKSSSYGTWSSYNLFSYNPLEKKVSGNGTYNIALSKSLGVASGDLNLYKLASNHLEDVPLLSGGNGSTGDMMYAFFTRDDGSDVWQPETEHGYFPGQRTEMIDIELPPNYYNVDTAAQGYAPIAAAYKPGTRVVLSSTLPGAQMIFGGIYNADQSRQFWSDNIGVTPLVVKDNSNRIYSFDVLYESQADPAG